MNLHAVFKKESAEKTIEYHGGAANIDTSNVIKMGGGGTLPKSGSKVREK